MLQNASRVSSEDRWMIFLPANLGRFATNGELDFLDFLAFFQLRRSMKPRDVKPLQKLANASASCAKEVGSQASEASKSSS